MAAESRSKHANHGARLPPMRSNFGCRYVPWLQKLWNDNHKKFIIRATFAHQDGSAAIELRLSPDDDASVSVDGDDDDDDGDHEDERRRQRVRDLAQRVVVRTPGPVFAQGVGG